MPKTSLTAAAARGAITYHPDTGRFVWARSSGWHQAGDEAIGQPLHTGHLRIRLMGQKVYMHRLAWLLTYGDWPTGGVDHIDGDPANNKLSNLRCVSHRSNIENQRRPHRRNKSGFAGVFPSDNGNRWRSCIRFGGKTVHLGSFGSPEAAHEAYVTAKRKHHEGCTL